MTLSVDLRHRVDAFDLRVEVTIPRGLTVVFGPSGSGKTTLLRLLAGLERPRTGTVRLDGRALVDTRAGVHLAPQRRRVGMVFQEPLLLPHRSAAANVAMAVREPSRVARRRRARHWLERVDALAHAERRPAQLSGGQQQRVALARALAGEPRLLLLDEPFSALDLPVRRRLRRLVGDLVREQGTLAVFVTHDRDELADLADRVVLADHGTVTRSVTVAEALADLDEASGPADG